MEAPRIHPVWKKVEVERRTALVTPSGRKPSVSPGSLATRLKAPLDLCNPQFDRRGFCPLAPSGGTSQKRQVKRQPWRQVEGKTVGKTRGSS